MSDRAPSAIRLSDDHERDRRAGDREQRAEQDRRPSRRWCCGRRVEVEEQRGEPEPGAEHDAGRDVAAARALDADQLHHAGRRDRDAATNPHSGPTATRKAPDPPVVPMSPSASPAKDWPRMTVNTPTDAADDRDDRADAIAAICTVGWSKKPGAKIAARIGAHEMISTCVRACAWSLAPASSPASPGDDQHAAVDAEHVDVVAVELAEHVACARPPRSCRSRRGRRRGRRRGPSPRAAGSCRAPRSGPRSAARGRSARAARRPRGRCAGRGSRAARPAAAAAAGDQGVGDQDALLLAAGEAADALRRRSRSRRPPRASPRPARDARATGSATPKRCASRPRPTRSRARSGTSGSSRNFCGT